MQKEISVDSFKAREISERELAVDMVYCSYRIHVGTAQNICGIKSHLGNGRLESRFLFLAFPFQWVSQASFCSISVPSVAVQWYE